jgi:hypothetical protein
VRVVNQTLNELQVEKHPEKMFIGKIERGFEFLGYHFRPGRLTIVQKTVERFVSRASRLYEQEPGESCDSSRLGQYVQRWTRWARAGLGARPGDGAGAAHKPGSGVFLCPSPLGAISRFGYCATTAPWSFLPTHRTFRKNDLVGGGPTPPVKKSTTHAADGLPAPSVAVQ